MSSQYVLVVSISHTENSFLSVWGPYETEDAALIVSNELREIGVHGAHEVVPLRRQVGLPEAKV